MQITPQSLPALIETVIKTIEQHAEEVNVLDQILGDGDHVTNLQRGLVALDEQKTEISQLDWAPALKKIGMTLLSTMGGASGSLFGTLFLSISKATGDTKELTSENFSDYFFQGVEAVKQRGKADAGEKTMLDVLIPVAKKMQELVKDSPDSKEFFEIISSTAKQGMESTREMLATKGRASYLQEKSVGHIDAGARTSQLMICALVDELNNIE